MISEIIEKWIKGILIDGITGNLSGLFDNVNAKVGEIASDVGSTPQAWNSGIFNMLRSLSETVVLPIAAAILALVMCHELIQMITEKNNMHDFDTSMFFRWIFKSAFAILIVSNTWNIVMGVFDATQSVVNQSSGVIIGETLTQSSFKIYTRFSCYSFIHDFLNRIAGIIKRNILCIVVFPAILVPLLTKYIVPPDFLHNLRVLR